MDWIETTGKTIDDAKEAALDELGVDEDDAEFEIVSEPKSGLFGRVREEARVRARVRPTAPRPKEDRRDRKRRSAARPTVGDTADRSPEPVDGLGASEDGGSPVTVAEPPAEALVPPGSPAEPASGEVRRSRPARGGEARGSEERTRAASIDVPLGDQAGVAEEFLVGLVEQFGLHGQVSSSVDDDEGIINVDVNGDGLGLLIGPKGATLLAIQDLTRSAVQQKTGAGNGRLNVDVSGYRAKRSQALVRFAQGVAEQVRASGTRQALEPMMAVDRKTIHDALTDVDGVSTMSEGEDEARRIVIIPAGG